MKLKNLSYYYTELNGLLHDGDNFFIKKYTTNGFIKSIEMWNKYSHSSIEDYFNDFQNDYSESFLNENCNKCFLEISKTNKYITVNQLFDVLIRRLVLDSFIGFKAEEIIEESLNKYGIITHNNGIISPRDEFILDTKYNVDIITFKNSKITNLIQVKNKSTFGYDGKYIIEKRKEFFNKNKEVNLLLKNDINMTYYIYDKMSYVNNGVFRFFINRNTGKFGFKLNELIDENGKMITSLNKSDIIK